MQNYLDKYDELYVVSDLHMGGNIGFQIFRETKRLSGLIRWIKNRDPKRKIALVVNGDIIDSLAEPGLHSGEYAFLDPDRAEEMLQRLYKDPSFVDIWNAFSEFIAIKNRTLVIVVGNHDIELALPFVQASIMKQLSKGNQHSVIGNRIVFSTYGAGYSCFVGSARVFCTHGNEVDDWNVVDYNKLSQLANALNAGRRVEPKDWRPNAGTQLVVDAMNELKKQYPFVDLLKPERTAVFGVLLTLAPELVMRKMGNLIPIINTNIKGKIHRRRTLDGTNEVESDALDTRAANDIESIIGRNLCASLSNATAGSELDEDDLLSSLESDIRNRIRASDAAEKAMLSGELGTWDTARGWGGLFVRKLKNADKVESLRQSLKDWLEDDTSFSPSTQDDETFDRIMERVGPDVQFVVTGHTHLARAIEVRPGSCYYFNSGTWIRLIRFTKELLENKDRFDTVFSELGDTERKMDSLDNATIPGPEGKNIPLVLDRTNVVRIAENSGHVVGELLRVRANGETDAEVENRQELEEWSEGSKKEHKLEQLTPQFVWR